MKSTLLFLLIGLIQPTWVEFQPESRQYKMSVPEGTVYDTMGTGSQIIDLLQIPNDDGKTANYQMVINRLESDVETSLESAGSEELMDGILSTCDCTLESKQEMHLSHVNAIRYKMTSTKPGDNNLSGYIYLIPTGMAVVNISYMALSKDVAKYQTEAEQIVGSFQPL